MLVFYTIVTEGFVWEEDDQGVNRECPVERNFTMKASRDTLDSLLRGIERILQNSLAEECYVILKEKDTQRSGFIGVSFEGDNFGEMMEHHRTMLLHALTQNGIE